MSSEICQICKEECTPWIHINGHICQNCGAPNKWISILDKLPDECSKVLTHSLGGGIAVSMFFYRKETNIPLFILMTAAESLMDNNIGINLINVTHWMPLPNLPIFKTKENDDNEQ